MVSASELPGGAITYYKLFMDNGRFGDFELVSYTSASLNQISIYNLTIGLSYRFKVIAINHNEESQYSVIAVHFTC